ELLKNNFMEKEEYEFNGFRYLSNSNEPKLDIVHNKNKPEYICKYYSISKYSVEALLNGYLYASHPFELNDIFDSSVFLMYASQKLEYHFYQNFNISDFYTLDCQQKNRGYISRVWELFCNIF